LAAATTQLGPEQAPNQLASSRGDGADVGRVLEALSTQPGVQFYSGNFGRTITGKGGWVINAVTALPGAAAFPGSINHRTFPARCQTGKPIAHHYLSFLDGLNHFSFTFRFQHKLGHGALKPASCFVNCRPRT